MTDAATRAFLHCLEPVDGATGTITGPLLPYGPPPETKRFPAWDLILDEHWLAMRSDGERALIQLGLQLFNGGNIPDPPSLSAALTHLDLANTGRFIEAVAIKYGWQVTIRALAST